MKKKHITHHERCCLSPTPISIERKPTIRKMRKQVYNPDTGMLSTSIEEVTVDRCEEMKPYRVSDFCLENLIAIGATLDTSRLEASPHQSITAMEHTLANIAHETNNNTNK